MVPGVFFRSCYGGITQDQEVSDQGREFGMPPEQFASGTNSLGCACSIFIAQAGNEPFTGHWERSAINSRYSLLVY